MISGGTSERSVQKPYCGCITRLGCAVVASLIVFIDPVFLDQRFEHAPAPDWWRLAWSPPGTNCTGLT